MRITALEIRLFRNLERVSLEPHPQFNFVHGLNGQGKTNLLEAIFSTLRGKSFRPYVQRNDWVPHGESHKPSEVFLRLKDKRGFENEVTLRRHPDQNKWMFYWNGKNTTSAFIQDLVPTVAFSPDDHRIVRGGPEERREFLNDVYATVCPGYTEVLDRFEEALKSRNKLLRKLKEQKRLTSEFSSELKSWSEVVALEASKLSALRRDLWPDLQKHFELVQREFFAEHASSPSLDLKIAFEPNVEPVAGQSEDPTPFLNAMRESFTVDQVTGWTHKGPHRDELSMTLDAADVRSSASQGQARLLALALRWTHASWVLRERGENALFLVDDFSSELDASRRSQLFSIFSDISAQIFMTGTEARPVDSARFFEYKTFSVLNGKIASENGPLLEPSPDL